FNNNNNGSDQLTNLRARHQHDHSIDLSQNSSQNHSSSSLLCHNITPAHQSSTPKSIFANGNIFSGGSMRVDAASSIVPNASGGSSSSGRRKQKLTTNIPPNALYMNSAAWLHNSEGDDDE